MDGNTLVAVFFASTALAIVGVAFAMAWRYRAKL